MWVSLESSYFIRRSFTPRFLPKKLFRQPAVKSFLIGHMLAETSALINCLYENGELEMAMNQNSFF